METVVNSRGVCGGGLTSEDLGWPGGCVRGVGVARGPRGTWYMVLALYCTRCVYSEEVRLEAEGVRVGMVGGWWLA